MKLLTPLVLLAVSAAAAPDCSWSGRWSNRPTDQADNITTFKTNGTTPVPGPGVNNTSTGCTAWIMIVDTEGFSAFSVELDTAPTASPGVAGSWSNSNLTTSSGSNPTTSSPSTYLATGYYPWFRVNVTTVTGTPGSINVQVFGWRSPAYLSAGSGGGDSKGVTIYPCVSSSGSGTTYTCTTGSSVTLTEGMTFLWVPDVACSGTPTINIDGNGAVIFADGGYDATTLLVCATLVSGPYKVYSPVLIRYDTEGPSPLLHAVSWPYSNFATLSCNGSNQFIFGSSTSGQVSCSTLTFSNYYHLGVPALMGTQLTGAPAISGCSSTIGTGSTNIAGFYTSGTTGTCSVTLTWTNSVTYTHGPICDYNDVTTPADTVKQTSYTTTTAVSSGTTVSGDVIYYKCIGF